MYTIFNNNYHLNLIYVGVRETPQNLPHSRANPALLTEGQFCSLAPNGVGTGNADPGWAVQLRPMSFAVGNQSLYF